MKRTVSKILLVLFVLMASKTVMAFNSHSEVFNFTPKKLYYSIKETSQAGKVPAYKSTQIEYIQDKITVSIYRTYGRLSQSCSVSLSDKEDVFVYGEHSLRCKKRAERIPKEF